MEKHEAELAKSARPPWTEDEPFDVEDIIAKGMSGEVLPIPFERLSKTAMCSRETSTEEISRVCADVLRRMNGENDDFRKTEDIEPDEEDVEQEPDAEVKKDIAFLRAQCGNDTDAAYELVNAELHKNYSRGRALGKALAFGFAA